MMDTTTPSQVSNLFLGKLTCFIFFIQTITLLGGGLVTNGGAVYLLVAEANILSILDVTSDNHQTKRKNGR